MLTVQHYRVDFLFTCIVLTHFSTWNYYEMSSTTCHLQTIIHVKSFHTD